MEVGLSKGSGQGATVDSASNSVSLNSSVDVTEQILRCSCNELEQMWSDRSPCSFCSLQLGKENELPLEEALTAGHDIAKPVAWFSTQHCRALKKRDRWATAEDQRVEDVSELEGVVQYQPRSAPSTLASWPRTHTNTLQSKRITAPDGQRMFKLVLDLDFTLVHSRSQLSQLERTELAVAMAAGQWEDFRVIGNCCIKLRPGVSNLLHKLQERCQVYICTLGTLAYATEMWKILSPIGDLILLDRVFSKRGVLRASGNMFKDLDGICTDADDVARTIILDDMEHVWPDHKDNVINCVPYTFFPGDKHCLYKDCPPLMDSNKDEDATAGPLSRVLEVILNVIGLADARGGGSVAELLGQLKGDVLTGLHISVCGFNQDQAVRLGSLAQTFGATVEKCWTSSAVTHVVATDEFASAVARAAATGQAHRHHKRKAFVTQAWLDTSTKMFKKQEEALFKPNLTMPEAQKLALVRQEMMRTSSRSHSTFSPIPPRFRRYTGFL